MGAKRVSTCRQKWQICQKLAPRTGLIKAVVRGEGREVDQF